MDQRSRSSRADTLAQRAQPPFSGRGCDWHGCAGEGVHRAPRSRAQLREYWWFCLEHIRLYNAAWDYYTGMSEAEIEADMRRDTVWQRPSWPLGSAATFRPNLRWFDDLDAGAEPPPKRPRTATEHAMVVFELTPPISAQTVKARYKTLVKRYHPDANNGDKAAEERFKVISEAYRTLMNSLHA
ncbi:MAG: J domain-containing protein [Rhodospirillales bacterium]